jgi:uncharacterized RDD family membrane protein YckC
MQDGLRYGDIAAAGSRTTEPGEEPETGGEPFRLEAGGFSEGARGEEAAGFWRRTGAFAVDAPLAVAGGLLGGAAVEAAHAALPETAPAPGLFVLLAEIVVPWLYFAVLESSTEQATPGKTALALRVTDRGGNRVSFARATGRHFAKALSAAVFGLGFVMAGVTSSKQGLHDVIAGCLVVKERD